jgi:ATP-dependent DNA helicase DinG
LHATHAGVWLCNEAGEVRECGRGEAISAAAETPHIVLGAPSLGQRLGYPELSGLDLLELFAFVHPARFAVPTVAGLCRTLGIEAPADESNAARAHQAIAAKLLATLGDAEWAEREGAWTSNVTLARLGWGWAPLVGRRLAQPERGERMLFSRLPQWEEAADRAPPLAVSVDREAAQAKLAVGASRGPAQHGRRSRRFVRAQAAARCAEHAARGGGDRHWQDPGLPGAGSSVG